jgi:Ca2+ transporting ATPase
MYSSTMTTSAEETNDLVNDATAKNLAQEEKKQDHGNGDDQIDNTHSVDSSASTIIIESSTSTSSSIAANGQSGQSQSHFNEGTEGDGDGQGQEVIHTRIAAASASAANMNRNSNMIANHNNHATTAQPQAPSPTPPNARPGLIQHQSNSQRFARMVSCSLRNVTEALIAQMYHNNGSHQQSPIIFYISANDLSTLANERTVGALANVLDIARKGEEEAILNHAVNIATNTTPEHASAAGLGGEDNLDAAVPAAPKQATANGDAETPSAVHTMCTNLKALVLKIRLLEESLAELAAPADTTNVNAINANATNSNINPRQKASLQYQLEVASETAANALTSLVLKSSPQEGLDLQTNPGQLPQRAALFGVNAIAPKSLTSFWEFCWDALQDFVLIMLICLGIVSILVETTIGHDAGGDCATCWVEGAAILVAVCIVVIITATIDYEKQKSFVKLSKTLDDTNTKSIIRNGQVVSVVDADIVVGDVLSVNSHNLATICADCILLGPMGGGSENSNSAFKVDESSLTGESKLMSKKPGDVVLSGTTAIQGSGKMVVIAVGIYSVAGKIKARVYESSKKAEDSHNKSKSGGGEDTTGSSGKDKKKKKDKKEQQQASDADNANNDEEDDNLEGDEETPLFAKLSLLAKQIGLAGTVAAIVAFVASLILGLAVKGDPPSMIVQYFITAVTVLAVAVPEGLPLAVTLALAFSSSKMTSEQNLVKHLDACETMGCATTICTDKTGTLTANKMTARAMLLGESTNYGLHSDPSVTLAEEVMKNQTSTTTSTSSSTTGVPPHVLQLLANLISIATMNETVLHYSDDEDDTKDDNDNNDADDNNNNNKNDKKKRVVTGSEGNPTECALLQLIDDLGFSYSDIRAQTRGRSDVGELARFLGEGKQFDFTSARKMMSWAVPVPKCDASTLSTTGQKRMMGSSKPHGGGFRIYSKGASEVIASRCTKLLTMTTEDGDGEGDGDGVTVPMTPERLQSLNKTAERYARRGMRCLSLAYRDLPPSPSGGDVAVDWDATSNEIQNSDGSPANLVETELVFVGLVGIEDPLRKEVPAAIQKCYEAGIDVRMVTGDNPNTAVSIAHQAGILRDEHFIAPESGDASATETEEEHPEYIAANLKPNVLLEGKHFRERVYRITPNSDNKKEFDQAEFDKIWPHLRVLARSSPDDKLTLAHGLNQSTLFTDKARCKQLLLEDNIRIFPDRQVVAMTGDGTNDAPALKRADIGFAMGKSGTQIAKDAADIILLDDNFASIVTAAMWGRNVYASIQKFLQFQLTVNLAAVTTALVGAFAFQTSPLAAIQLLWINLLMDSLASLALASEPPTEELLKKPPVNRTDAMITKRMWANMIGHASYQIIVVLVLLFDGARWFGITPGYSTNENTTHFTLIFNSFVWMQLFNEINCRNLKGEHNVFRGVFRNPLFCGVWISTAVLQVLIVQFGSVAMSVVDGGLNGFYWGISLAFGLGSFPIQQLINVIYAWSKRYRVVRDRKRYKKNQRMMTQNISERS